MAPSSKNKKEDDDKKIPGTDKYITKADTFYRSFQDGVNAWEHNPQHPPTLVSYIGALMIMPNHSESEFPARVLASWNAYGDYHSHYKGNPLYCVLVNQYRQFAHSLDMPDGTKFRVPTEDLKKVKKRIRLAERIGGLEILDYEVKLHYVNGASSSSKNTSQAKTNKGKAIQEDDGDESSEVEVLKVVEKAQKKGIKRKANAPPSKLSVARIKRKFGMHPPVNDQEVPVEAPGSPQNNTTDAHGSNDESKEEVPVEAPESPRDNTTDVQQSDAPKSESDDKSKEEVPVAAPESSRDDTADVQQSDAQQPEPDDESKEEVPVTAPESSRDDTADVQQSDAQQPEPDDKSKEEVSVTDPGDPQVETTDAQQPDTQQPEPDDKSKEEVSVTNPGDPQVETTDAQQSDSGLREAKEELDIRAIAPYPSWGSNVAGESDDIEF